MMDSLWTKTGALPAFPSLSHDLKTDVLVIGGGLAGVLCAWMLSQAGIDCALIEADRVLGGVSANTTAKITSQHGLIYAKLLRKFGAERARMYYDANEAALARYRQLSRQIPCDFEQTDAFVYTTDGVKNLENELDALSALGITADFVRETALPFPVSGAVRFRRQAQFHPIKFAAGVLPGLKIYEGTEAQAFDGNAVVTNRGKITASKIIVATHFPIFNKHGGYFLKQYQHRSYVLALEGAPKVDGMYVSDTKTGLSFRNYGDALILGGGSHRTGKQGGGWAELTSFTQRHYPNAREAARWATQDCMSLDGIPYIGQYGKNTPRLYVATGFNKWGMTSAMISAMLLTDLVQEKENPYAPLFSPARSSLQPQLLCNALEATVNLLTPTKPRCPHMGCALKWNRQEHSWDCPCHGSRFSAEGKLLNDPATGDLKQS